MKVNISSERKPYEVGDLIEISGFGFRMIIKSNNCYFLINMEGQITTSHYSSIESLLEDRKILSHYKNKDLELNLKE